MKNYLKVKVFKYQWYKNLAIAVFLSIFLPTILVGQDYSRQFVHERDQLNNPAPTDFIMTSFILDKVVALLENPYVNKIRISQLSLTDGRTVHVMEGLNAGNTVIKSIAGDFPCPDECLPPMPIRAEVMFDTADVIALIARYPNSTYINVHLSLRDNSVLSYSIYAVSGPRSFPIAHTQDTDLLFISQSANP